MVKKISITVINDLVTDQRMHRIAESLVREGFHVSVIGRQLKSSLSLQEALFSHHRYKMLFRKGPLFYAFFNLRLFFSLLFMRRPSLFIAIDLDTLPANFLVSRIRKLPLLYDSHEYFTEVPELINRPGTKKIWERIEKSILPKLRYATAVSESIANTYSEKYGIPFETVRNVSFSRELQEYPEFNQIYSSKYKIIYQGALNLGRGIELMIKAMAFLEEATLFVVGDGDLSDELHKIADDEPYPGRIIFTGKIAPAELHRITCQCNLGLSLEEDMGLNYRMALPNKIFDYVQARIPVCCSDLPEMSALIHTHGIGEICRKRTPKGLAEQMREMLENSEKIASWKKNLTQAADELCWEKEQDKLLKIIHQALG